MFLILLILFIPCGVLCAESASERKTDNETPEIFARIARAASKIKTISSDFLQEKHLAMLEKVLISKGKFYYEKPDRLSWEILEPNSSGIVVNGDDAKRWQGQKKYWESFDLHEMTFIKAFVDQIFAWAKADFEWLEDSYDITIQEDNPVVMKLVPLSMQEKAFINHITLFFSTDDSYVHTIKIHENDEDYTLIKFINILINMPLKKKVF
jgi:outer membrane lipoprotein-sorting protein